MNYRSEIDGLRAFAVISVVIYHFFPLVLPSGYLGVDIFFIISGFLITSQLIKFDNKDKWQFLKQFYIRRIKRLFPALFVFLLITTLTLSVIMLKSDFESYFSSLISAKTFWANLYFWQDGGYFGGRNDLKPLLHTWSLSVEEQFYLIYPSLILIFIWIYKKFKIKIIYLVATITVISFIIWFLLHSIGGANPAFFILPTRIWQFGLGGLIALLSISFLSKNRIYNNLFLFFSLLALTIPLFFKFVGIADVKLQVILVSLGAALFLHIKPISGNKIIFLFKNSISIWFGKISYSFYLYHWPIAVILHYYFVDQYLPYKILIPSFFLSILLSYLSYRFVEVPFRYKFDFKFTIFLLLICTISSFVVLQFVKNNNKENIANQWSSANGDHFRCKVSSIFIYGNHRACYLNKDKKNEYSIAVVGNSHAQMYGPLFEDILKETNQGGILIVKTGCLPTVIINISKSCFDHAQQNLKIILNDTNIKHVFVSMNWYGFKYIDLEGNIVEYTKLVDAINDLANHLAYKGKTLSVFSPIQTPGRELANELPRMLKFKSIPTEEIYKKISIDRKEYDDKFNKINMKLRKIFGEDFIPVYKDLCDDNYCYFARNDIMYFADSNHLSRQGVISLKETRTKLRQKIQSLK